MVGSTRIMMTPLSAHTHIHNTHTYLLFLLIVVVRDVHLGLAIILRQRTLCRIGRCCCHSVGCCDQGKQCTPAQASYPSLPPSLCLYQLGKNGASSPGSPLGALLGADFCGNKHGRGAGGGHNPLSKRELVHTIPPNCTTHYTHRVVSLCVCLAFLHHCQHAQERGGARRISSSRKIPSVIPERKRGFARKRPFCGAPKNQEWFLLFFSIFWSAFFSISEG